MHINYAISCNGQSDTVNQFEIMSFLVFIMLNDYLFHVFIISKDNFTYDGSSVCSILSVLIQT